LIKIAHLSINKSAFPCSGPLTSEPAIGWLESQLAPFFKYF